MSASLAAVGATGYGLPASHAYSRAPRKPVQSLLGGHACISHAHVGGYQNKQQTLLKVTKLAPHQHAAPAASCQDPLRRSAHREAFGSSAHQLQISSPGWNKFDLSTLSSWHCLGGTTRGFLPRTSPPSLPTTANRRCIVAARKDRRWPPWGRDRRDRSSSTLVFALGLVGLVVPVLLSSAGVVAAAFTIPTIAVSVGAVAALSALTAVLAIVGPLLLFFVPVFGLPLALLSGFGFWGFGGVVRTVLDIVLTLTITSNFVGALVSRAQRKQAAESEEEEKLSLGEQLKRMALAEVERGLRDMRSNLPSEMGQKKAQKPVKKESAEDLAVRRANEANEALREVANVAWWGPTVLSLVPGLNGLAWFAATDAFPTAVQGTRRGAFIRNALIYGAPALLYLLSAPFQGVSVLGYLRGEAWWLSLVFGLVHLQLERKDMVEEARTRARESALPEPDELERASKELMEFDAQLSRVAWSSETPSKWTEANVGEWLRAEGLGRLVGAFAEQHIDGSVLLTLKGDELRDELGITSLGDRKRILAAIERLQAKDKEWAARVVQELDT
ncbi:hypothetical protein KFL_002490090 [Klebsormidium nitens]|uniref:SAM domain-containing protein n=1 Tax=Klebsormidium nitens TaxID=105231 RepID=A0A1Y1I984_KLENI|nr:hypothetical protein KFL_002490090 [Klebsormidium nitens]|eukprot:GAQ85691.1 hypothetical protein KFL_002490090 [Klebsormidium nitens]